MPARPQDHGGFISLPPWCYTGPGSALTYGKRWDEQFGKIFLLCTDYQSGRYRFFKAPAYFDYNGQTVFLNWQKLKPPPVASPIPEADAALCYMGNPVSSEEKVLAVFSGGRYLWSYDVPSDTWYQEIPIGRSDSPGAGVSLKFGGFREKE